MTGRWHRLDRCVRSVAAEGARVGLLTGRWVTQRPDAERLRPVELSDGTVARVEHRTLVYVRSRWTGRVRSKKYASGSLLETTERWGFSVRSVLTGAFGQLRSR